MDTDAVGGRLHAVRTALLAVTALGVAMGAVVYWWSRATPQGELAWGFRGFSFLYAVAFAGVGYWILGHRARNVVGWSFLVAGALTAVQALAEQWAIYAIGERVGAVGGGAWGAWLVDWLWIPSMALLSTVFLVFPDGKPLNRRWALVLRLVPVATAVSALLIALRKGQLQTSPVDNPVGLLPYPYDLTGAALLPFMVVLMAGVASLLFRARRARGPQRTQLRWLVAAAVPGGVFVLVSGIAGFAGAAPGIVDGLEAAAIVFVGLVPVAMGIAILRHQLFDIDLAINRTLVVGALVAFVTVVYAALVGGVGALLGERANLTLSMVATGLVAVGFHPVRMQVQRWSNRLVYGDRATPYEVLSTFASRLEGSVPTDDLLQRVTELLADGTGATAAQVWLRVGDELRLAASAPDGVSPDPVEVRGDEPPTFEDSDHTAPVVHRGELLGALTLTKPRGEPLSPADVRLVDGLAGQAGLLLRNRRLTAELLDLVEQLRASRQRLVAVQDEERRRLERDLHDGAQQHIVALKLKAVAARTLLERGDPARAGQLVGELVDATDEAVEALRELAHGIYPPLLASDGLGPAVRSRAARSALAVDVDTDGQRYPREVEAAVYFCVLEALQNITKYAHATHVRVEVARDGTDLRFEVADDGEGFDPGTVDRGAGLTNMSDRLDALGGQLAIRSAPDRGTRVVGRIPLGQAGAGDAAEGAPGEALAG